MLPRRRNWMAAPCAAALALALAATAWAGPADDQFAVAARHYQRQWWRQAADAFEAFLSRYPDHAQAPAARFYRGEALVQLGDYAAASAAFADLLTQNPAEPLARQAAFRAGETAYLSGQADAARTALAAFRERYPQDELEAYALPYLAELELAAGEAEAAERLYAEALERFPTGPLADECRFGGGRALETLGKPADAERLYAPLAADPQRPLADDAQLRLGALRVQADRAAEAAEALREFEETFPQSELRWHARYWRGEALAQQGQWSSALTVLDGAPPAPADHPLAPALEFRAGEALRKLDRPADAAARFARVAQQWPTSEWADDALQAGAAAALALHDHARVDELTARFAREFPDSPLASAVQECRARSLLERGQASEAAGQLETLLENVPADAAAATASRRTLAFSLALARLSERKFAECLAALDQAEEGLAAEDASSGPAWRTSALAARGASLMGLARYEEALAPLAAYLEAAPDGGEAPQCRAQLAAAYAALDRLTEADAAHVELEQRDADSAYFLPTTQYLAEKAESLGETERARRWFARLTADDAPPQFASAGRAGLARLDLEAGDAAAAEQGLERLREEHPETAESPEALWLRAVALERQGKLEPALGVYRQLFAAFPAAPQTPPAMLAAARLHDQLEQDREAAALLEQLAKEHAEAVELDAVLYQWAWALADDGRDDEADAVFARLAREHAASRYWSGALYRLAERAARAGRAEEAERLAAELLAAGRDDESTLYARYLQGQLAATAHRWAEVAAPMEAVVAAAPEGELALPARFWIAEAAYRQGQFAEARSAFDELAAAAAESGESWLALVELRRAQTRAHDQQWSEAYDLAAGLAQRYPGFRQQYEADYLLGRCLASQARFAEARAAYERVVASPEGGGTETGAMAQWMIGETYFLQKNYPEAIRAYHLAEAKSRFPRWQAASVLQAGKCYEMLGQWREAVRHYTQLLQDYAGTEFEEEASKRLGVARQRAELTGG